MTVTTFLLATADVPLLYAFLTPFRPVEAAANVARALSVVRGECYIDDDASDSGRYPAVYGDGGVYGETHCATYTIGGAVSAAVLANIAAMGMVFQAYIYDASGEYAEYTDTSATRTAAWDGAALTWVLSWEDLSSAPTDYPARRAFCALWEITVSALVSSPPVAAFKAGSLAERWRTALAEHNTPEPMDCTVVERDGCVWRGRVAELPVGTNASEAAGILMPLRDGGTIEISGDTDEPTVLPVCDVAVIVAHCPGWSGLLWSAPVEVRS